MGDSAPGSRPLPCGPAPSRRQFALWVAVGEGGGSYGVLAVAVAGPVGGVFGCVGAVVGGVEGELVSGLDGGLQVVGAQGVGADPGALQGEGFQQAQGGGRRSGAGRWVRG